MCLQTIDFWNDILLDVISNVNFVMPTPREILISLLDWEIALPFEDKCWMNDVEFWENDQIEIEWLVESYLLNWKMKWKKNHFDPIRYLYISHVPEKLRVSWIIYHFSWDFSLVEMTLSTVIFCTLELILDKYLGCWCC